MGTKSSKEAHGAAGKGNLLLFDPEKVHLITDKAHKLYDPRVELAVPEELIASIAYKGVVEPIIVWKDPETGHSCVVDGRQRVKAAREANKLLKKRGEAPKLVKAVVVSGTAVAVMGTMVVANEGRTQPTATQRSKLAERLMVDGYDEEQVATLLHCSKAALKNYLALAGCVSAVRQAVESERVPPTVAYKLSKLEPEEQRKQLEKMLKAAPGPKKRGSGKKMREAVGERRMRTRKEVQSMIDRIVSVFGKKAQTTIDLLGWVIGGEEPDLEVPKKVEANGTTEEVNGAVAASVPG
jgi:ParB family chromosome partitioning protein